ncbi:hypothetical protein [Fusicatenibacter sp.]
MWIKKIPGIAANVAILILDVFAILMIAGLFLHQGTAGERVKETITRFSTTSQEYYSEGEAYSQTSDRVHTYVVKEASK